MESPLTHGAESDAADIVRSRLALWSEALAALTKGDAPAKLVQCLETADRLGLESLMGSKLFLTARCIDIVETITRVVNFGSGRYEKRCEVISQLFRQPQSSSGGRVYRLPDGTFIQVSDELWVQYAQRAQDDAAWRAENVAFLEAIGILRCEETWVPDEQIVSITTTKTLCFPALPTP